MSGVLPNRLASLLPPERFQMQPEQLVPYVLRSIPGLELVELRDSHLCCGSAGAYNIDPPEIAGSLGRKKAQAVMETGGQLLVSGNIGCLNQTHLHLAKLGSKLQVRRTMQLLREAYARCRS